MSFHLFGSLVFIDVLWSSANRSCTCLNRLAMVHCSGTSVNGIKYLLSNCSLLVHRNTIDFWCWPCILWPWDLRIFITLRILFAFILNIFYIDSHVIGKYGHFFSWLICITYICFSCFITLVRILILCWVGVVRVDIYSLISIFRGITFSLSLLTIDYFFERNRLSSWISLYSLHSLLKGLNMQVGWILWDAFSASICLLMWLSPLVCCYSELHWLILEYWTSPAFLK